MRRWLPAAMLVALIPVVWVASAEPERTMFGRPVVLTDCLIRPAHEAKVPARVAGVLAAINVREGDTLKSGQTLALVDDREARINLEELTLDATRDDDILIAEAKSQEMQMQVEEAERLGRNISKEEKRLKKAQLEIAQLTVQKEKIQKQLRQTKQKAGEEKVLQHQIVSPIEGFLIQQVRQLGEAVQVNDPVFHVIQTDVVKVQGTVPLRNAGLARPGMAIEVYPNLPGREVWKLYGHTDSVLAVRMLPDGKHLVSAGADGALMVWSRNEGRRTRVLYDHVDAVHALAVHKNFPRRVISAGADQEIRVWDIGSDKPVLKVRTNRGTIHALAPVPTDPDLLVSSHDDRSICIYDLKEAKEVRSMTGHANPATSLAVTPDGKYILSASGDQTARVWELATGSEVRSYRGRSVTNSAEIGLSTDGKNFLFDSFPIVQVQGLLDGLPIATIESRTSNPSGIALFSPVVGLVLTAGDNGQIYLWHQGPSPEAHSRLVRTYDGHPGGVYTVDFSADGGSFVSGGADRVVRVFEVPSPEAINRERMHGVITFVSQQTEPGSLSVPFHAEVPNKDGILKVNAFATVLLRPGTGANRPAVGN